LHGYLLGFRDLLIRRGRREASAIGSASFVEVKTKCDRRM